jgi:hypothetical protein
VYQKHTWNQKIQNKNYKIENTQELNNAQNCLFIFDWHMLVCVSRNKVMEVKKWKQRNFNPYRRGAKETEKISRHIYVCERKALIYHRFVVDIKITADSNFITVLFLPCSLFNLAVFSNLCLTTQRLLK